MMRARRLPASCAGSATTHAASSRSRRSRDGALRMLFHRGGRARPECNLAAAIIERRILGRVRRHQPVALINVLDGGRLAFGGDLFRDQPAALILHAALVVLRLATITANGSELHAVPIE